MRDFEEWIFPSEETARAFLCRYDIQNDYSLAEVGFQKWNLIIFHDDEIEVPRPTPMLDAIRMEFDF